MQTAERLIGTWIASGRDEEIEETVAEISNSRLTLIDVVKALGEYLTSEEDELRTKGVDFLSSVLGRSPVEKLNRQSVRVLTTFYCEKLEDFETRVPALKGLSALVRLPTCSSTDAASILQAMFSHVMMRALVASVRFFVFSIIDTLMVRHRDVLKGMGKKFMAGYISLAEGEKDPRNLLTAFAITRVILLEFDISEHVESLFNITSCYFPVMFRPPPNDPYGITTDDLRLALRSCLHASPSFGPLAIPIFLDKLMAGSPSTKRDTLQTMAACFPVFGSTLARANARKLWNSLKLEIFQPTDPQTEKEALKTVQVLVETIYSRTENPLEHGDDVQGLARDACEECIQILREPEKSQAQPAIKVLCAFMATTPSVSRYTLSQGVPHLVKLFLNSGEVVNRPPILLLLADLVNAARDPVIWDSTATAAIPLMPYKDEILGIASVGLKTPPTRLPALSVIEGIVMTKYLLSDEELGFIVHLVNEVFNSEDGNHDDMCDSKILDVLMIISTSAPRHVREQSLPLFFSSLPDRAPARDAVGERAKYWRILLALSTLCVHPELFETLVIRLMAKLDLICVPMIPTKSDEPDAAYAQSLLKTIADTLLKKAEAGHPDVAKYADNLVPRLYSLFVSSALMSGRNWIATNPRLVGVTADIIMLVTQCLPHQRQAVFVQGIFEVFSSGDVRRIADGFHKLPSDCRLKIFDDSATDVQRNLLTLFTAGIVTSDKEVRPPITSLDEFLDRILTWSLSLAGNDLQRESAWHLISSIVNKRTEDIKAFLEDKIDNFWFQKIANADVLVDKRRQAILAWVWMSKALLIRNHPLATQFTDVLFQALGDNDISWDAARAIGGIASSDLILTKRHHAVIKILHAQKFVNNILPRIIAGARNSNSQPQEQMAYLVALTSLIKAVPKATYMHEMTSLIPLLLRGLNLPDTNLRADVIDTLLSAAEGDAFEQSLVSEHASTLVTYMLKNSMISDMPSVRVRVAALRYLGVLPGMVRYDILHPSKPIVIRELGKVLDDPKRSVRKEAVDTRTVWFKYNG